MDIASWCMDEVMEDAAVRKVNSVLPLICTFVIVHNIIQLTCNGLEEIGKLV